MFAKLCDVWQRKQAQGEPGAWSAAVCCWCSTEPVKSSCCWCRCAFNPGGRRWPSISGNANYTGANRPSKGRAILFPIQVATLRPDSGQRRWSRSFLAASLISRSMSRQSLQTSNLGERVLSMSSPPGTAAYGHITPRLPEFGQGHGIQMSRLSVYKPNWCRTRTRPVRGI